MIPKTLSTFHILKEISSPIYLTNNAFEWRSTGIHPTRNNEELSLVYFVDLNLLLLPHLLFASLPAIPFLVFIWERRDTFPSNQLINSLYPKGYQSNNCLAVDLLSTRLSALSLIHPTQHHHGFRCWWPQGYWKQSCYFRSHW